MNDIAFLSDIHFGHSNFSKKVFDENIGYFEQVFFPFIKKNGIKHVVFAGDISHNRDFNNNYILQEVKERFFKWFDKNGVIFHCLIGNHDSVFKNRIDYNFGRCNLNEFDHVIYYDENHIRKIEGFRFAFMPWINSTSDIILPDPKEVDILVGHFDIKNALMQGNVQSQVGLDINIFKPFKKVVTGHYHTKSILNNVIYLGSTYQMSYRDYNSDMGFWTMDDKMNITHHENTYSPKYLKLFYVELEDDFKLFVGGLGEQREVEIKEAIELIEKNYFKFIVKKYNSQKLLQDVFKKLTSTAYDRVDIINEVSSIEDFDVDNFQEKMNDDNIELLDIMKEYVVNVKFNSDNIDNNKISNILSSYYKKVRSDDND